MTRTHKAVARAAVVLVAGLLMVAVPLSAGGAASLPAPPPLAQSDNVAVLGNIPIPPAAGINFKDHFAFVTGWEGVSVLDIAVADAPTLVGFLPLPHFENEDVDLCGNTLLVSNDREQSDRGAFLYVIDITNPAVPGIVSVLPLGWTGSGRGSGHIANFVKTDCTQVWVDGGNLVEVVDLTDRANPRSLGKFESAASLSPAFKVTHDTELDSKGMLWSVGGAGAAGYALTKDPLKPRLVATTGQSAVNTDFVSNPYNDFILHNSQRRGTTLLITEEDYVDTDQEQPGSCHGQGKFETWSLARMDRGAITPLDTWETELNGLLFGGSPDSKAPATVNCSSHWFDENGGIAAVGWYEQGTRFLDVSDPKNIRQVGFYLPDNGSTWAAYWSPTDPTHQIVYTADVYRGVDVLRIQRPATGTKGMKAVKAPIPSQWYEPRVTYRESTVFSWFCPVFSLQA
jgi:hypothetical protein